LARWHCCCSPLWYLVQTRSKLIDLLAVSRRLASVRVGAGRGHGPRSLHAICSCSLARTHPVLCGPSGLPSTFLRCGLPSSLALSRIAWRGGRPGVWGLPKKPRPLSRPTPQARSTPGCRPGHSRSWQSCRWSYHAQASPARQTARTLIRSDGRALFRRQDRSRFRRPCHSTWSGFRPRSTYGSAPALATLAVDPILAHTRLTEAH